MDLGMDLDEVIRRLDGIVRSDYQWPRIPAGWSLEFIAYSDASVDMDLLQPQLGVFWSEDNEPLKPPVMVNGQNITASALKKAGIPFMTTFLEAAVCMKDKEPNLANT
jgi:hypothetical protein